MGQITTAEFFLQPHGAYGISILEHTLYTEMLIEMREGGCAGEKGEMKGAHAFLADIAREVLARNRKHNEEYDRLREASKLPRPNDPIVFDERS